MNCVIEDHNLRRNLDGFRDLLFDVHHRPKFERACSRAWFAWQAQHRPRRRSLTEFLFMSPVAVYGEMSLHPLRRGSNPPWSGVKPPPPPNPPPKRILDW